MDDTDVETSVLSVLEGNPCTFCGDGTLVRSSYKGNAAVICDDCRTPGAQMW
jgi:hypothetical protein